MNPWRGLKYIVHRPLLNNLPFCRSDEQSGKKGPNSERMKLELQRIVLYVNRGSTLIQDEVKYYCSWLRTKLVKPIRLKNEPELLDKLEGEVLP